MKLIRLKERSPVPLFGLSSGGIETVNHQPDYGRIKDHLEAEVREHFVIRMRVHNTSLRELFIRRPRNWSVRRVDGQTIELTDNWGV